MTRRVFFITHPNVVISCEVPVPKWPLSAVGLARMKQALALPWISSITTCYSSTEQKAIDGARILCDHLSLPLQKIEALGENDRSSTGFLPPPEFEAMANRFFGEPESSVKGWERAVDAQARIVSAVSGVVNRDTSKGAIAIVSHGAVGTLLYCHLAGLPISREWDQPPNSGGNYFEFSLSPGSTSGPVRHWWQAIDVV